VLDSLIQMTSSPEETSERRACANSSELGNPSHPASFPSISSRGATGPERGSRKSTPNSSPLPATDVEVVASLSWKDDEEMDGSLIKTNLKPASDDQASFVWRSSSAHSPLLSPSSKKLGRSGDAQDEDRAALLASNKTTRTTKEKKSRASTSRRWKSDGEDKEPGLVSQKRATRPKRADARNRLAEDASVESILNDPSPEKGALPPQPHNEINPTASMANHTEQSSSGGIANDPTLENGVKDLALMQRAYSNASANLPPTESHTYVASDSMTPPLDVDEVEVAAVHHKVVEGGFLNASPNRLDAAMKKSSARGDSAMGARTVEKGSGSGSHRFRKLVNKRTNDGLDVETVGTLQSTKASVSGGYAIDTKGIAVNQDPPVPRRRGRLPKVKGLSKKNLNRERNGGGSAAVSDMELEPKRKKEAHLHHHSNHIGAVSDRCPAQLDPREVSEPSRTDASTEDTATKPIVQCGRNGVGKFGHRQYLEMCDSLRPEYCDEATTAGRKRAISDQICEAFCFVSIDGAPLLPDKAKTKVHKCIADVRLLKGRNQSPKPMGDRSCTIKLPKRAKTRPNRTINVASCGSTTSSEVFIDFGEGLGDSRPKRACRQNHYAWTESSFESNISSDEQSAGVSEKAQRKQKSHTTVRAVPPANKSLYRDDVGSQSGATLESSIVGLYDTSPYYIEELAFHAIGTNKKMDTQLMPLPKPDEPPKPSDFPNGSVIWKYNEQTRVLLVDFTIAEQIFETEKRFFGQMMQRDDITVVSEGLIDMNVSDEKFFSYLRTGFGTEPYHKFKAFVYDKKTKTFVEQENYVVMYVKDYIRYLEAHEKDHCDDLTFRYRDDNGKEQKFVDVTKIVLYMIDVDMPKYLPMFDRQYKTNFRFKEILPSGEWCMMNKVS
jgi:hypothetical protein